MRKFLIYLFIILNISAFNINLSAETYDVYNYDKNGDAILSQAGYTAERSVSGRDLGISDFNSPNDIFKDENNIFYIADTDNNRIVVVNSEFDTVLNIYQDFIMPDGTITELKNPMGIYVSEDRIYIADTNNSRVIVSDFDLNVVMEITRPDDDMYRQYSTFLPQKIIVDSTGNIYVVLNNITTGVAMFNSYGDFLGFYGANRTDKTIDIIKNLFRSDEKKARQTRNVPSGITNFDIDIKNFIYTCTQSENQSSDIIKKLNSAGRNIFLYDNTTFGDYSLSYSTYNTDLSKSAIVDIDVDENEYINCLDFTNGRVFQYDRECNLMFILGTKSNQLGGFEKVSAIESTSDKIYVLDSMKSTVTIFKETVFGELVHNAENLYNSGEYEKSLELWYQVLKYDGNYQRAYVGIASALLIQEDYSGAMKYAKLSEVSTLYNKAFEGWRSEFLKKYALIVFIAMILILWLSRQIIKKIKSKSNRIKWLEHTLTHGYEDLQWKKSGSMKLAFIILIFLFIAVIMDGRFYGMQFRSDGDEVFNIIPYIIKSFGIFLCWIVSSRATGTFLDGSGTMKNICIYSSYALVPYIMQLYLNVMLSHILTADEIVFIEVIKITGILWTAVLTFMAVKTVHQYTIKRTFVSIFLTVTMMIIMLCLFILILSLFQQVYIFVLSIYTEISYRLKI